MGAFVGDTPWAFGPISALLILVGVLGVLWPDTMAEFKIWGFPENDSDRIERIVRNRGALWKWRLFGLVQIALGIVLILMLFGIL